MAFFKTLLIASVAAVAFASPQGASDGNTKVTGKTMASDAVCGNGQKLACCNSGEDLIGANCLSIPIRTFLLLLSHPLALQIQTNQLTISPSNSRHPHPAVLRLQRRRLLPDRRRQGQPHQPRAQLPLHPPLSASPCSRIDHHSQPLEAFSEKQSFGYLWELEIFVASVLFSSRFELRGMSGLIMIKEG
jgi:hypothetical protein